MYEYTKIERIEPELKLSKERIRDYREIYALYSADAAGAQASRCIQCGIPYCSAAGCPLHNYIPQWLKYIAEKDLEQAFHISNETSPFPEILGRICPHDRLCEGACTLNDGHGAVTIGAIEIFINETGFNKGLKPLFPDKPGSKRVAIIGSGPAGLSCATFLLRAGIRPVVFERADEPGGLLTYGIPGFKLEKEAVYRRIKLLKDAGMEMHLQTEIGRDIAFNVLCEEYDAVFLGFGATEGKVLSHEGYNADNIYMAVPFLTNIQKKLMGKRFDPKYQVRKKNVLVIGGGDTAMDCVRTAVREGALSVRCIYRRDEASMPGSRKEVKASKEEGVEFIFNTAPKHFMADAKGNIMGMKFMKTELIDSAEGRPGFREIPGSDHIIEGDVIILALGFNHEQLKFLNENGIQTDRYGAVVVDDKMQTSRKGVFAGGDAVRGADLVVNAAADGRAAALAIAEYLLEQATSDNIGAQPLGQISHVK
ncbi:MAG: glutamate synthase subunit beta [Chitinophagales bacterium]|nr:MAG: glutamate synthase subunit beta [Chitinophagales bacterium]